MAELKASSKTDPIVRDFITITGHTLPSSFFGKLDGDGNWCPYGISDYAQQLADTREVLKQVRSTLSFDCLSAHEGEIITAIAVAHGMICTALKDSEDGPLNSS